MNKLLRYHTKRIWALCAPFRFCVAVIIAYSIIWQIIAAIYPIILGRIVNAVSQNDMHTFAIMILAWLLLGTVRTAVLYIRERFEIKNLDYELSRYMARISLKKFFDISMGQHHLGHSIIKKSIMSKGEAAVSGTVYQFIYDIFPTILMIVIPLGLLVVSVWQVGMCVFITMSFFVYFTVFYNLKFIPKMHSLETLGNKIGRKRGEIIENADVVFVNAQEDRVREECDTGNVQLGNEGRPMWLSYVGWSYSGMWSISVAQAVCLAVAGYLVYRGEISAGMFVTVSLWIGSSLGMLTNISRIQRMMAKNVAPLTKYYRFLDYRPDIVIPDKSIAMEHIKGRIEFRHVSFTYVSRSLKSTLNDDDPGLKGDEEDEKESAEKRPEIPAIKDVSFVLGEGKRYAFVGRSGAGKSTMVGLIIRAFDPQSGHVLIDGVDLRMLNYRELRRNVGLVPQDVSLFDETMRYNITFGLNGQGASITDADLDRVAKLSRISEFSGMLEKGWDTIVGERGIKLSGGQKQRVGIARALIKNPHILIFDEATSSLDTENEAKIRESIVEASVGKTTIIIAHRLATVRDADQILVFDQGNIVGQGTHEELIQTNDHYKRLVHNQVIMA